MTRSEFLEKLRGALENDMQGSVIQENVDYYNSYISEEVRKGRGEEEVIAELGDPWVLARSVIDMAEQTGQSQEARSSYETTREQSGGQQSGAGQTHTFAANSWWKVVLVVLGIIGVLILVVAMIGGIFSLLAPIVVPILIVVLVLRLLRGNRR